MSKLIPSSSQADILERFSESYSEKISACIEVLENCFKKNELDEPELYDKLSSISSDLKQIRIKDFLELGDFDILVNLEEEIVDKTQQVARDLKNHLKESHFDILQVEEESIRKVLKTVFELQDFLNIFRNGLDVDSILDNDSISLVSINEEVSIDINAYMDSINLRQSDFIVSDLSESTELKDSDESNRESSKSFNRRIYRFFLPFKRSIEEYQQFHRDIEWIKSKNPKWEVVPDMPKPGEESEAWIMVYKDENYLNSRLSYLPLLRCKNNQRRSVVSAFKKLFP